MRYPPVGPELRELLAGGEDGHDKLRKLLENYHPNEAAELLTALQPDEITEAMSLLDIQVERDLFGYFEPELQEQIVLGSSRSRLKMLLEELPSDERAEFLDQLDDSVRDQLMPLLAREARLDVLRREQFDDDQVGAIMSTEFCVLGEGLTIPRALEEVRRQAPSKETIYYSYVLDRDGKLKGFISLRNLIVADPRKTVGQLMKTEVVSVDIDADQEEAAAKIREYDLLALPVVDKGHHMVGIITHDDAVDIIDEENTEDIKMMAGIMVSEDPDDYLSTSVWGHFRGRVTWLTFLAISFLGVAWILHQFKDITEKNAIVVSFFPLLLATGANVGGQASALILRELAVNDRFDHGALMRVVWKELRIGLALSLTLGTVVFALTAVYALLSGDGRFDLMMSTGIAGAVGAHVISAAVIGSVIPLVFSRMGMQPEVFSHPALNCVADTGGTLIYVAIIWALLPPAL